MMETYATAQGDFTLRPLESFEDYAACIALQRETWGRDFADVVPMSILKVCQRVGGVSAGAFDASGRLAGFVFGLTGVKEGRLVHWSDMLAVYEIYQGLGLGKRLKLYQRDVLLAIGVETIYWTFDPLVARNANLNFNGLGADLDEYVENMYGDDTSSDLHRGLGTDRFVVAWHIGSEKVRAVLAGRPRTVPEDFADAPIVNAAPGGEEIGDPAALRSPARPRVGARGFSPLSDVGSRPPAVRIEVPKNIHEATSRREGLGVQWRLSTREAFTAYLGSGYSVKGFYEDESGRCFYGLQALAVSDETKD